mmetsp:Transcript_33911/g.54749  ORF Transcript_33911/g.54749 Transcript_33911/m.54749 type:complete len:450 (-) Transcript_33911:43-1392(-)
MRWILVPLALAASADAAMAFAPTSSFTPAARSTANTCRAAPRSARLRSSTVKMNNMEEISQEEYEELLRAAGQPAAAQPAAAKPAGGGGMFGGMFGGGGAAKAAAPAPMAVAATSDWQELFDATYQAPYYWNEKTGETSWDKPAAMSAPAPPVPKPAAARSGGGLISPGSAGVAKPRAVVQAKPRQQAAAMFDDDDYLTELPPVSKQEKPQTQQQRAAEAQPAAAAERASPAAAAAPSGGGGGFFGGLFGGGKKAAPKASVGAGQEQVSEKELRELMAAAGKDDIDGYSLSIPAGKQTGYKKDMKQAENFNPSAASMAPAPTNTGVTDLGGVKVTTIRKGDGRSYPQPGDLLTMHYVGKLRDTKQIFDSSIVRGPPLDFVIGQGQVIRGWDEGIQQMTLGEKAQLVVQSDYGYGASGKGAIPPNADLVFDVDLLAINGVKPTGRYAGGN